MKRCAVSLLLWVPVIFAISACGSAQEGPQEEVREPRADTGVIVSPGRTTGNEMMLTSSAVDDEARIGEGFQCSQNSIWLPLEWETPPQSTAELVVVIRVAHVPGKAGPEAQWIIAGINPGDGALHFGLPANGIYILPVSSKADCPREGETALILADLYAIPAIHSREDFETADNQDISRFDRIAVATGRLVGIYGPSPH
jgi:hypothetical protein